VVEIAPLSELLTWLSEVFWLASTVETAVDKLVVDEIAPLRDEEIWLSEVD